MGLIGPNGSGKTTTIKLILNKHNPTIYLTTKGGGVPQEDRQALTDEQVERLLDAIRDLPPYVFVMIGLYSGLRR